MKKATNIKRMGVKSVHYKDNTVFVEDSFSKETSLLYSLQYDDIDSLDTCQKVEKFYDKSKVNVTDILNKRGFELSKILKNETLKSRVEKVKNVSYLQNKFNISKTNNIEIQIYNNFEDIKKIITTYFNNVLYTINSLYKDVSNDSSFIFDKIGSLKVGVDWDNFLNDSPSLKQKWEQEYLPNFQKVLNRFGLKTEKNLQINYIKCIQYVAQKNGYKTDFTTKINEKIKQKLDNLLKNEENNQYLLKLALTPTNEFCPEANKIVLYKYFFKNKRIERIVLNKLENDEVLKNLEQKIDENKTVYNYLRLFSAIRQYVVHNNQKIRIENNTHINDNPKRDVAEFASKFAKNNYKYFCILKSLYEQDEDIFNKFYEYTIFEDSKNMGVSMQVVKKKISSLVDITQDVEKENLSEYQNKFKTLVIFVVTEYLKANTEELENIVKNLKECPTLEDKDKIYQDFAKKLVTEFDEFKQLREAIKMYKGEVKKTQNFEFYPKAYLTNQSVFFNAIYVMSKFLTQKESRLMFSKILNKYQSIKNLLEIANLVDVKISQETLRNHKTLFVLDIKDTSNEEYQEYLQEYNIKKIIQQLKILKSIRTKDITTKDYFVNETERIFDLFKCDKIDYDEFKQSLSFDENEEVSKSKFKLKPLKSYLKNEVYLSKQYQYISNFSSTRLCKKIMSNKNLITLVINNMLDKNNPECVQMQQYIARVYHDFKGEVVDIKSSEYMLSENQIEELVDYLHSFKIDDVVDTIFQHTDKNYKVIVRLYMNVCYLIIKNIVTQNSSYIVQIQDYENLYSKINNLFMIEAKDRKTNYDLCVVNDFLQNSPNKTCRSYKQLQSLLQKDYIKNYINKAEYLDLLTKYRNAVVHMSLFNDLEAQDFDFNSITNVKSYFGLYQILLQQSLKPFAARVWGEDYYELFEKDNKKQYSTKLCIALNIPFAYNISRFNNNTIEQYAVKKFQ